MRIVAVIFFVLLSQLGISQDEGLFVVKEMPFCSKNYDEYNLIPYKKGAYLISNQPSNELKKVKDLQNRYISSIFFQSNLKTKRPSVTKIDLKMNYHIGSFCLNAKNDLLIFTAQKSDEDFTLGLYVSEKKRNAWSKPRLIYQGYDKMNLMDPFMTPNGDTLFFVANMPGGMGGTDIYMATGSVGHWESLRSLEKNVNTAFNERYPKFYNNTLYYSSTRNFGNGGLDIYSVRLMERGFVSDPFHFPAPVNTENDDFAYYPIDEQTGYFSSNRNGNDDVFHLTVNFPQFDCFPHEPIVRCFEFTEEGETETDTTLYEFVWKFSDGASYKGDMANHCFKDTGDFTINLELYDRATKTFITDVAAYEIEIRDPEQLEFDMVERIGRGSIVRLKTEKENPTDQVTFYWDFGDGTFGVGKEITHVYNRTGQFQISLGMVKIENGETIKLCTSKIITVMP